MTQDLFEIGRRAARAVKGPVGYREDGAVILALGAATPAKGRPRFVHYHPLKTDTLDSALERLGLLRREFPTCELHGLSPGWLERHGQGCVQALRQAGLHSLSWFTGSVDGPSETPAQAWEKCADLDIPKVASFIYGPQVTRTQVEERVEAIVRDRQVCTVLPLPRGLGDKLMQASSTTDGILDARVLSWTRLACGELHVRASWGALGWKMAQPTLLFGVDELAGRGLEEVLAYGPQARAAAVVRTEEVEAGIREAGHRPLGVSTCAWVS